MSKVKPIHQLSFSFLSGSSMLDTDCAEKTLNVTKALRGDEKE